MSPFAVDGFRIDMPPRSEIRETPIREALHTQRKPIVTLFLLVMVNGVSYYLRSTHGPILLTEQAGISREGT